MAGLRNPIADDAVEAGVLAGAGVAPPIETTYRAPMIPYAEYSDGSAGFSYPQIIPDTAAAVGKMGRALRSAFGAEYAPADVMPTPEDANLIAGLAMTGGLAVPRPRGSFASGAARAEKLPADLASRMARAKELGFDTDTPYYHGTFSDFDAFDPAHSGRNFGGAQPGGVMHFTRDPERASMFTDIISRMHRDGDMTDARVMPLYLRNARQSGTKEDAFVQSPSDIRSIHADFDPSKSDSSDILSANPKKGAAAGVLPAAATSRARELDARGFYSPSLEAAKAIPQETGTVQQMKAMLLNAGAKPKELEAVGFDKAFPDPQAKVSRGDIEGFLRGNRVELGQTRLGPLDNEVANTRYAIPEVMRAVERSGDTPGDLLLTLENDGDAYRALQRFPELRDNEDWAEIVAHSVFGGENRPSGASKFESYSTPGGIPGSYREVVTTLPQRATVDDVTGLYRALRAAGSKESEANDFVNGLRSGRKVPEYTGGNPEIEALIDKVRSLAPENTYTSSHWPGITNPLLHYRVKDFYQTTPFEVRGSIDAKVGQVVGRDSADLSPYTRERDAQAALEAGAITPDEARFYLGQDNRVRVLDELQSDWAQRARDQGRRDPARAAELKAQRDAAKAEMDDIAAKIETQVGPERWQAALDRRGRARMDAIGDLASEGSINELAGAYYTALDKHMDLSNKLQAAESGVPPAPYISSTSDWVDLGLKQALMDAVKDPSVSRLAWAPGKVNADRYGLHKVVDTIEFDKATSFEGAPDGVGRHLVLKNRSGVVGSGTIANDGTILNGYDALRDGKGKNLSEYIGKEWTDRLLATKHGDEYDVAGMGIGGEGMRSFYGDFTPEGTYTPGIVGTRLRKLVEKYDPEAAKIEAHNIGPDEAALLEQARARGAGMADARDAVERAVKSGKSIPQIRYPSIPITDTLRARILEEGLPLFVNPKEGAPVGWLPAAATSRKAAEEASHGQGAGLPREIGGVEGAGAMPGGLRDPGGLPGRAGLLEAPGGPRDPYARIPGIPATVKIPGYGEVEAAPVPWLVDAASSYMRKAGREHELPLAFGPLDRERARRIAQAYEEMPHDPANPAVRRSYEALADETLDQYRALAGEGAEFRFNRPGEDPYAASPAIGYPELRDKRTLSVFPTFEGYGERGPSFTAAEIADNPMLKRAGVDFGDQAATLNDLFRAVHDAYGHYAYGNPFFRAPGEERAWMLHSGMYSPEARGAMTTELRGQNNWLNFGPHAEHNRTASAADTVYAPQKIGLMPEWVWEEGRAGLSLDEAIEQGLIGRAIRMARGEGRADGGAVVAKEPELRSFEAPWYDRMSHNLVDLYYGPDATMQQGQWVKKLTGPENPFNLPAQISHGADVAKTGYEQGDWGAMGAGVAEAGLAALPFAFPTAAIARRGYSALTKPYPVPPGPWSTPDETMSEFLATRPPKFMHEVHQQAEPPPPALNFNIKALEAEREALTNEARNFLRPQMQRNLGEELYYDVVRDKYMGYPEIEKPLPGRWNYDAAAETNYNQALEEARRAYSYYGAPKATVTPLEGLARDVRLHGANNENIPDFYDKADALAQRLEGLGPRQKPSRDAIRARSKIWEDVVGFGYDRPRISNSERRRGAVGPGDYRYHVDAERFNEPFSLPWVAGKPDPHSMEIDDLRSILSGNFGANLDDAAALEAAYKEFWASEYAARAAGQPTYHGRDVERLVADEARYVRDLTGIDPMTATPKQRAQIEDAMETEALRIREELAQLRDALAKPPTETRLEQAAGTAAKYAPWATGAYGAYGLWDWLSDEGEED